MLEPAGLRIVAVEAAGLRPDPDLARTVFQEFNPIGVEGATCKGRAVRFIRCKDRKVVAIVPDDGMIVAHPPKEPLGVLEIKQIVGGRFAEIEMRKEGILCTKRYRQEEECSPGDNQVNRWRNLTHPARLIQPLISVFRGFLLPEKAD